MPMSLIWLDTIYGLKKPSNATGMIRSLSKSNTSTVKIAIWPLGKPMQAVDSPSFSPFGRQDRIRFITAYAMTREQQEIYDEG
jgi:hypothetical protein